MAKDKIRNIEIKYDGSTFKLSLDNDLITKIENGFTTNMRTLYSSFDQESKDQYLYAIYNLFYSGEINSGDKPVAAKEKDFNRDQKALKRSCLILNSLGDIERARKGVKLYEDIYEEKIELPQSSDKKVIDPTTVKAAELFATVLPASLEASVEAKPKEETSFKAKEDARREAAKGSTCLIS